MNRFKNFSLVKTEYHKNSPIKSTLFLTLDFKYTKINSLNVERSKILKYQNKMTT